MQELYLALTATLFALFTLGLLFWNSKRKKAPKTTRFTRRLRKEFQKRYPNLRSGDFTPLISAQNQCCAQSMVWTHANFGCFCDQCGAELKTNLEKLPNGVDLATLNKVMVAQPNKEPACAES